MVFHNYLIILADHSEKPNSDQHKHLNIQIMKTTFYVFLVVLLFSSCKKKEDKMASNIDRKVEISVQDKAGNDLLNPSNPNAYLYENIKTYYVINGVKEEVNNANYDNPKNFMIYEKDGKYLMRLFLNMANADSPDITYVQWSENNTDTFKCESSHNDMLIKITKLWYNDSLVWTEADYSIDRSLLIVK